MKDAALFFKALGDETRLKIVQMLRGQELCVCDILAAFDMSQPAISHHLKILKQAEVVQDSRDGKWIYYSLNPAAFDRMNALWRQLAAGSQHKQRRCPCASDETSLDE